MVFPEIDYDKIDKIRGLNVTIHTTAKNDEQACELLKKFNMPFAKKL
jgi:large subunit ribosomal protein L5